MSYSIIQPPFTLRFDEMAKTELAAYRKWFHQIIPERSAELTKAVRATPGYEMWQPDHSPESLDDLGRWFEGQVATRKTSPEEIEEMRSELTFPIEIPTEELTNRSLSLALDIGMYFALVVLKNLPGTRWEQPLRSKKLVDYGQPVIMGFGIVPLNPVRVLVSTAYGVSRQRPAQLRETYETWAAMRR